MTILEISEILKSEDKFLNIEIKNLSEIKDLSITSINSLSDARPDELSYCDGEKNSKFLAHTKAKAVLVNEKFLNLLPEGVCGVVVEEPHLAFALLSRVFSNPLFYNEGENSISNSANIMQNVHIGSNVSIGENSVIMPGCFIGDNVKIGKNSILHPNVVVYNNSIIGDECHLMANCVIGCDGFGYAHTKDGRHIKIYHNGKVVLEDFVEVGACTTIDRGVFKDTLIKSYTKIDNLVQIGHNCELGFGCLIVSQTGLSGSSILGRNVVMGGQSGTAGHLNIGDFAQFAARAGVSKSLEGAKKYAGHPCMELNEWFKTQAKIIRLTKVKK